jgi:hypothetical protein
VLYFQPVRPPINPVVPSVLIAILLGLPGRLFAEDINKEREAELEWALKLGFEYYHHWPTQPEADSTQRLVPGRDPSTRRPPMFRQVSWFAKHGSQNSGGPLPAPAPHLRLYIRAKTSYAPPVFVFKFGTGGALCGEPASRLIALPSLLQCTAVADGPLKWQLARRPRL